VCQPIGVPGRRHRCESRPFKLSPPSSFQPPDVASPAILPIRMPKRQRTSSQTDDNEDIARSASPAPAADATNATPSPKIAHLNDDRDEGTGDAMYSKPSMYCSLPPHKKLSFLITDEYEVHYLQTHINRCIECDRNFPSGHFLLLHIAENHDPINEAKKERGDKIVRVDFLLLASDVDFG
jgi:hypothetical protein